LEKPSNGLWPSFGRDAVRHLTEPPTLKLNIRIANTGSNSLSVFGANETAGPRGRCSYICVPTERSDYLQCVEFPLSDRSQAQSRSFATALSHNFVRPKEPAAQKCHGEDCVEREFGNVEGTTYNLLKTRDVVGVLILITNKLRSEHSRWLLYTPPAGSSIATPYCGG